MAKFYVFLLIFIGANIVLCVDAAAVHSRGHPAAPARPNQEPSVTREKPTPETTTTIPTRDETVPPERSIWEPADTTATSRGERSVTTAMYNEPTETTEIHNNEPSVTHDTTTWEPPRTTARSAQESSNRGQANIPHGHSVLRPSRGKSRAGRYMVKFKNNCGLNATTRGMSRQFRDLQTNTTVRHKYNRGFYGVAVQKTTPAALRWLISQECVEYIEEVGVVKFASTAPAPVQMVDGNYLNWGLDRISETVYNNNDYSYNPKGTGDGIDIYILDSGVRRSHDEFSGRASYLNVNNDPLEGEDCFGHGTQAAGIAIGSGRGTAKQANVISIKVLDCYGEGSTDDLLTALNRILDDSLGNALVSMSFTTTVDYSYIHQSIINLVNAKFVVVAAAGNENDNACYYYPGGYSEAINVGAINARGNMASWSNYGPCVDMYAPGSNIYTATNEGDNMVKKLKGTSFAAPFVSGAAAILLEQGLSPRDIKQALIDKSTKLVQIGNLPPDPPSHNRILFVEQRV